MPVVIMLNVDILSIVMLSVVMLSIVVLTVKNKLVHFENAA